MTRSGTPPGNVDAFVDGLRGLFGDPERAARMGTAGRARAVATYAPALHVSRLEALYAEVAR